MDESPALEVRHLSKTYGSGANQVHALHDLTFSVTKGEFVCIVGPSGCGKTTLLRCLSALQPATSGEVRLFGELVTSPPAEMAFVFQDYSRSLMPWLTVSKNVLLPLRHKRLRMEARERLVNESVGEMGLTRFLNHYPWQLSGGMQQRVAIARAIAYEPQVLVMDEPFASVDAQTRADLEDLILRVRDDYGITVILVTHDVDEAVYVADRIIVLTSPPATIREVVEIPLRKPRDQVMTRELPEFAVLRASVFQTIRGEQSVAAGGEALIKPGDTLGGHAAAEADETEAGGEVGSARGR